MVKRDQHKSDGYLQYDAETADEEHRQRLLDVDDIEIAVEQCGGFAVGEEWVLRIDRYQRDFCHHARVKPPRKQLHQVDP